MSIKKIAVTKLSNIHFDIVLNWFIFVKHKVNPTKRVKQVFAAAIGCNGRCNVLQGLKVNTVKGCAEK